jgi:MFS family permease
LEIVGLPLHPLVVHAVVVFAPIAAFIAVVYAVVPRWRWALREVLLGTTVIAVVTALVATQSGEALLDARPFLKTNPNVADHIQAGQNLRNALLVFTVVVFCAAFRLGGSSALTSGRGARPERPRNGIDIGLVAVLLIVSVVVMVTAVIAGHSGATAVWA